MTITAYEVSGLAVAVAQQVYQLPTNPQERHLDFKTTTGAQAARLTGTTYDGTTYLAIGPIAYATGVGGNPGTGLGWQGGNILAFDRGAGNPNAVLGDGHYNTGATFLVDLPGGAGSTPMTYQVTPTLGDSAATHDLINLTVGGSGISGFTNPIFSNLTTTAPGSTASPNPGPFANHSFLITVAGTGGQLVLTFQDQGGVDPNFTLQALDIRPQASVATITITPTASSVTADGTTVDTYTGTVGGAGLPNGSEVTLSATLGTLLTADVDATYAGVQVVVNSNTFMFTVRRPSGAGVSTLTADELTGKAFGTTTVTYTLPTSGTATGPRHLDFGTASSPVAAGYLGVPPQVYTPALGLGWQTGNIQGYDRGGPTPLLRDFNYSSNNALLVDLPSGPYVATVTMGDAAALHDNMDVVDANGTSLLGGNLITSPAGQFSVRSFTASSIGGRLTLGFLDRGGADPNFVLNALDIRPATGPNSPGVITIAAQASPPPADGMNSDTFTGTALDGSGAPLPMGAEITVATNLGAITSADADSLYAGIQVVVTDAAGHFSFTLQRPTGTGTGATITALEVTGKASGSLLQTYSIAATRRFDFNAGSNVTAAGFLPVRAANLYTATAGFGWVAQALEYDRGSAAGVVTTALYQDFHYGTANTFEIQVTPGGTYGLRIYMGDAAALHDNMKVSAEGGATQTVTTPAGMFQAITLTGVDADSNGILTISFQDLGGADPNFVVDGIDVALGGIGALPGAAPQLPAGGPQRGGTAAALTVAELAPVVQEAEARWEATGLSADAVARLQQAQVQIADLSSTGALGLTGLGESVVRIDATAEGYGWYIDPTAAGDSAFTQVVTGTELHAAPGSLAAKEMDLLTVVMHELGHVLGYDDVQTQAVPHGLMTQTLAVGVRRLPGGGDAGSAAVIDQAFAQDPASLVGWLRPAADPVAAVLPSVGSTSSQEWAATVPQGVLACGGSGDPQTVASHREEHEPAGGRRGRLLRLVWQTRQGFAVIGAGRGSRCQRAERYAWQLANVTHANRCAAGVIPGIARNSPSKHSPARQGYQRNKTTSRPPARGGGGQAVPGSGTGFPRPRAAVSRSRFLRVTSLVLSNKTIT